MARYALFVGVVRCEETLSSLYGPENDVEILQKQLEEQLGGFADRRSLTGQACKKSDIRDALEAFRNVVQAGDSLLFYFAGHGTRIRAQAGSAEQGDHEALCPSDFSRKNEHNAILDEELTGWLVELHPDVKITVILDCCFAGGMPRNDLSRWVRNVIGDGIGRVVRRLDLPKLPRILGAKVRCIPPRSIWHRRPQREDPSAWRGMTFQKAFAKYALTPSSRDVILFGACRTNENAIERGYGSGFDAKYYGVFTKNLVDALASFGQNTPSNSALHGVAVSNVAKAGNTQTPVLWPPGDTGPFLD